MHLLIGLALLVILAPVIMGALFLFLWLITSPAFWKFVGFSLLSLATFIVVICALAAK